MSQLNWPNALRRIAVLVISASITTAAAPARAGAWVADAKSGCQVWNPNPQLEEAVTWSGSCANGRAQGRGVVQWIKGGVASETDEGEWREGYQVGKGKQTWPSGSYEGEFANSEPNGRGIFVLQNLRYDGEFRNGKPNGTGALTGPNGTLTGHWTDGCFNNGTRKTSFGVPLSACP